MGTNLGPSRPFGVMPKLNMQKSKDADVATSARWMTNEKRDQQNEDMHGGNMHSPIFSNQTSYTETISGGLGQQEQIGSMPWAQATFGNILSNEEAEQQMTLSQEMTYTQIMEGMSLGNVPAAWNGNQEVGAFTRLLNTPYDELDFDDGTFPEYVDDHTFYLTSDRHINISEMEQDELDKMYNIQNDIGAPTSLTEEHVEDLVDWIQKDEALDQCNEDAEQTETENGLHLEEQQTEITEEVPEETAGGEADGSNLTQEEVDEYIQCSQQQGEQRDLGQDIENMHLPAHGMVFKTQEEAHKFYNYYAMIVGFSTSISHKYYSRNKDLMGKVTRLTVTCNKAGKPTKEDIAAMKGTENQTQTQGALKPAKSRQRRTKEGVIEQASVPSRRTSTVVLTSCPATMVVTYIDGMWKITRLNLDHNHELHPPGEARFLRSHKKMTAEERMMIRTCSACKIPTRKIMAILAYMRGGLKALPYTKKDVSNIRTSIRNESGQKDMMKVLAYFLRKKEKDPMFFYKIESNEEGRVTNIFWSDAYNRELYKDCGDLVSFDTTYRTNKYNLPFAPIVGITSHGDNCLFGCAFLENETTETFVWLFNTLLECMGGKEPISIITDQDAAMRMAIRQVLPRTNHRNCLFHIMKKAQEKAVRTFATTPNLHDDFMDIVHNSITIAEFERLWPEMIVKYQLEGIAYFKIMWANRWRFVPAYFKQKFYPFVQSTARSEGTNAIFKDNVSCTYSVSSFLAEYDRIAESIEERQKHHDCVTRTTKAKLSTRYHFELQAARLYNRAIFFKFQKQVVELTVFNVEETDPKKSYSVYKSETHAAKDFRPRRYVVTLNLPSSDYSCICAKFQKDGLLCAHVLRVLVHLNITTIHEKYFIDRWRPKEKKVKRNTTTSIPEELTADNSQMRYNIISTWVTELASQAAKDAAKYAYLLKKLQKIQSKMSAIGRTQQQTHIETEASQSNAHQEPSVGAKLKDPVVTKPKGRPTEKFRGAALQSAQAGDKSSSKKRMKTIVEQCKTKNRIKCGHCGEYDHNKQTCKNLHIDYDQRGTQAKKAKGKQHGASNNRNQEDGTAIPIKASKADGQGQKRRHVENTSVQP